MKNGKVLVTGASGFIGYKVYLFFMEQGYDVVGWDRKSDPNELRIVGVDMNNRVILQEALKECNPDIIIHCAGSADVGKSVQNPEIDYMGNVTLTHNLLFALHKTKGNGVKVIFLSSAAVYGNPKSLPITEDMESSPLSPYAVHKVMCEELCKYFVKNYGIDIKIARIFSAYGTGLKKQIFWDMNTKVKNTGELRMFGTGNESRDYIHVDDIVKVLYLLATEQSQYIVFNVANGEEVTIREATEIFANQSGIEKQKISFNGIVREGDPLNWRADISRIKEIGYEKTVDIETGLKEYAEWCKG